MAVAMKMLGTSVPCKKALISDAHDLMDTLWLCFKNVRYPKRVRLAEEEAKTQVLNLCLISNGIMEMACELAFHLHRAGPGGKGSESDRQRLQNEMREAIRDGKQDKVSPYMQYLKDSWVNLNNEMKKLDIEDKDSYISKTSLALKAFIKEVSSADSKFWTKHPRVLAALGGAIVGGGALLGLAALIAVPALTLTAGIICFAVGFFGGGAAGGLGMAAMTPNPLRALKELEHLKQKMIILRTRMRSEYRFLERDDSSYLLDELEKRWSNCEPHDCLKEAILGYPELSKTIRKLQAAF
eukprot:scpid66168/ scgid22931/ 